MHRLCVKPFLCAVMLALVACSSSPSVNESKPPVVTSTKSGSAPVTSSPATPASAPTKPEVVNTEPLKTESNNPQVSKPEASKNEASKSVGGKKNDAASAVLPSTAAPELPPIPADLSQRFEQAISMLNAGDTLRAESELQKLTTSYPTYSGPFTNLGLIYIKNGRFAEAEKALLTATKLSPQNAAAFNQLGIAYRNLGKFKDADVAYTNALAADSEYALAYLNLGVLCDLYLQQPKRALEAFERYQSLVEKSGGKPEPKVDGWIKELRGRLGIKAPTAAPKPASEADAPAAQPATSNSSPTPETRSQ
jgi:Flp pilus assembly protein TadD